jgi:hypothetical protein
MLRKVLCVSLLLMIGSVGAEDTPPKPGSFYQHGQLGIKKTKITGAKIKLTFKPVDEQFYWCPGIKVQTTDKATVVTFVRCKTSKSCGVDAKASIGKRLIRTVTIDTKGMDTYVRNGPKKFKKIYTSKKKPAAKAKKTSEKKKLSSTTKTQKSDGRRPRPSSP